MPHESNTRAATVVFRRAMQHNMRFCKRQEPNLFAQQYIRVQLTELAAKLWIPLFGLPMPGIQVAAAIMQPESVVRFSGLSK